MKVKTKYFAFLRERLGISEETLEVPDKITVKDFVKMLTTLKGDVLASYVLKEGNDLREGIAIAYNGETLEFSKLNEVVLKDGDTIVILPPISGGN